MSGHADHPADGPLEAAANTTIATLGVLYLIFAVCLVGACAPPALLEAAPLLPPEVQLERLNAAATITWAYAAGVAAIALIVSVFSFVEARRQK